MTILPLKKPLYRDLLGRMQFFASERLLLFGCYNILLYDFPPQPLATIAN